MTYIGFYLYYTYLSLPPLFKINSQLLHTFTLDHSDYNVTMEGGLPVKGGLAEGYHGLASLADTLGDGQRLLLQTLLWDHPADQAVEQGITGRDRAACEQHLHGNLGK